MSRRRSIALVGGVVALLLVVALAAVGRPLSRSGGQGGGLPSTFWNVVYTTVLLALVLGALFSVATFFFLRRPALEPRPFNRNRTVRSLVILIAGALLVYYIGQHIDLHRLLHRNSGSKSTTPLITTPNVSLPGGNPRKQPTHFEWPEAIAVLGAVLALLAVYLTRSRNRPALRQRDTAPQELLAALDLSVDDLRSDPDVRHAIIAAYARMEQALAVAGLPRRPAEAPLEYLERVLLALDTSDEAVRRLTDLFEWARFSHHEPEPSMRDEAIDALVAVRDELRADEPVATW